MKKITLFILFTFAIFIFNSNVKADTFEYDYAFLESYFDVDSYSELQLFINDNIEIIQSLYNKFYEEYENYSTDYPYYLAQFTYNKHSLNGVDLGYYLTINFILLKSQAYLGFLEDSTVPMLYYSADTPVLDSIDGFTAFSIEYEFNTGAIGLLKTISTYDYPYKWFWTTSDIYKGRFFENFIFDANYDIKYISDYHDIIIHDFRNTNEDLSLKNGDIFSTYLKNAQIDTYMEINLNDYSYVALSLKDYNQEPFSVDVQVKGNYCITPVYNYGMTEKKDILNGSQAQRCSPYYNDYTLVRTYILEQDLQNNAIYYLKAYDTSKDNYVKIDTNIFNVTLITEDEQENPYVLINGKTYPTIPYDSLTDTAIKSEDEGYNSGASCAVGDFNCMSSSSTFSFSDIFEKPLEMLKSLWTSITSVFSLVTYLISLLPTPMSTFLFLSFTLAIAIGLIKMIL